jgi:hypothetical protein
MARETVIRTCQRAALFVLRCYASKQIKSSRVEAAR